MSGVDLAAMRQINSRAVLRALFQHGEPMKVSALVVRTQLSRRTAELILDQLVEDGWAAEVSAAPGNSLGRPPRSYRFVPGRALFVAMAVDTDAASVAIIDAVGEIHHRGRRAIEDIRDPEAATSTTAELAADVIRDSGIPASDILGAAFSVTGRVDDDGTVLHVPYAPRWAGFDPRDLIQQAIGHRPAVDNDANLAALGEQWRGSAQDQQTFVWLVAGVRLGAGLVIRNQIHRGHRGAAGQIVQVDSMGLHDMERHPLGLLSSPVLAERERARRIIESAAAGDADARAAVDGFLDLVEPILSTFAWTLAPTAFILGGGWEETEFLLPELERRLGRSELPSVELRASALGDDVALFGAARLARDSIATGLVPALREQHLVETPPG